MNKLINTPLRNTEIIAAVRQMVQEYGPIDRDELLQKIYKEYGFTSEMALEAISVGAKTGKLKVNVELGI